MILDASYKKRRKLFQEVVDSGFYYMRMHNHPDTDGTPFKQTVSKKRFTKALNAMLEFLEGKEQKVIKMKPKVTTYRTTTKKEHKLVHIIQP